MLNNIGLPGFLLIVVVTLLLFGRGKIGSLMGEFGSGLAAFKKGLRHGGDDAIKAEDLQDPRPASASASEKVT